MSAIPYTPAELKEAFTSVLTVTQRADPLTLKAVDELIEKIELVCCGEHELTPIELLFGRSLIQAHEETEGIWSDG